MQYKKICSYNLETDQNRGESLYIGTSTQQQVLFEAYIAD